MVTLDKVFTSQASPNIALIKYWGKRDEKLILPCNSSLSITLSSDTVNTITSIIFSKRLKEDSIFIDGKRQEIHDKETRERLQILEQMREDSGTDARFLAVSKNNFPAASGMASSASGIAALVYSANAALGLGLGARELSIMARQGSGSACRSIFGGLVLWRKGRLADGSDSYAEQLFDEKYWPEITDIIVIVSKGRKKMPSRAGMRQTVETNPLYSVRASSAEARISKASDAYKKRDFNMLAEQIMADSNEFHALAMSTRPPIRYLSGTSFAIMDMIEELNREAGENIAAYTFDAGPNAHIITQQGYQDEILHALGRTCTKDKTEIRIAGVGTCPRMLAGASLIDERKMVPK